MSGSLRILVIGCGDIAASAHLPALRRSTEVDVVGGVDADPARREFVEKEFGVPTFGDVDEAASAIRADAAIVATPPDVTPDVTMKALDHGWHVLCEKPMAVDVPNGRRLHAAATASGRVVQVGFTNRFSPLVQLLREAIAAGRLGAPLVYTLGAYDERYDPTNAEHLARMDRFLRRAPAFVHEGAHLADYVAYLSGARPLRVSAASIRTDPALAGENFTAANVEWSNGDLSRLEVGWLFPSLPPGHFRVLGPRASAEIVRREGRLVIDSGDEREVHTLGASWNDICFDRQLAHFVAVVRGEATAGPTTSDGLASLQLGEAVVTASRERRVVETDEVHDAAFGRANDSEAAS